MGNPDNPRDALTEAALSPVTIWMIALCLSMGPAVSNGFARFGYGLVLPAMREEHSWNYAQTGWLNTANATRANLLSLAKPQSKPRPFSARAGKRLS